MNLLQKNRYWFFLPVISAIYLSLFYRYGLNLWDEGVLLNGALRSYNGEVALMDFLGYPPGRYFLGGLMFKVFGIKISVVRLYVLLLTAVSIPILFHASLRLMPIPFALLPPALFLIAPAVYYNRFFPICTIINICALLHYIHERDRWALVKMLAVMGITLFFKIEIAVISFFAGCLVVLLLQGKKGVIPLSLWGITGLSGVILFAGSGFILDFCHYIFNSHNSWGTPLPPLFSAGLWSQPGSRAFFESILFYLPLFIYLIAALLLIKKWKRGEGGKRELSILTVILIGLMTYGLVIWRAGFDNLIRVLPPAWMLGTYLLYSLYQQLRIRIPRPYLTSAMLVLPVWFSYNLLFNYGFYCGSIGELRKDHVKLSLPAADVYANPIEAEWINEITSFIQENSSEHDTLFAVPLNPLWNFLSKRKNPTYYEWILPGMFRDQSQVTGMVEELEKTRPIIVICSDIAIDDREDRRFSRYAPEIYGYIQTHYTLIKRVAYFEIWKRFPHEK